VPLEGEAIDLASGDRLDPGQPNLAELVGGAVEIRRRRRQERPLVGSHVGRDCEAVNPQGVPLRVVDAPLPVGEEGRLARAGADGRAHERPGEVRLARSGGLADLCHTRDVPAAVQIESERSRCLCLGLSRADRAAARERIGNQGCEDDDDRDARDRHQRDERAASAATHRRLRDEALDVTGHGGDEVVDVLLGRRIKRAQQGDGVVTPHASLLRVPGWSR
jgi:hypothetical protein